MLLSLLFSLLLTIADLKHGKLAMTVRTPPASFVRVVEVAIVEENYERHSTLTLDPEDTSTRIEWRDVPEGEHLIQVRLSDADNHTLSTVAQTIFLSR